MFFNMFRYDIVNGLVKNFRKYFFAVFLLLIICIDFYIRSQDIIIYMQAAGTKRTYGDLLFYIFGGMEEYVIDPGNLFHYPELWILITLFISYRVLYYPYNDLMGFGRQVLVYSGSRTNWWFSKCCWSVIGTIFYFVLFWSVGLIFCFVMKINISMEVSDYMYQYCGIPIVEGMTHRLDVQLFLLPLLVMISVNLGQLFLSLLFKPLYSYAVTVTVFVASCYYMNPFLIGNYAMARRSGLLIERGMSAPQGIGLAALISFSAVAGGLIVFRHYDILNKE